MALCVLAGKRETEAGAARRMIGALVEPVEEVRQVFCGDAWPVIGNAELDAVRLLADGQSDVTSASGVAAGIDEQVADDLPHAVGIEHQTGQMLGNLALEHLLFLVEQWLDEHGSLLGELPEVGRAQVQAEFVRLREREVAQIRHEAIQAHDLFLHREEPLRCRLGDTGCHVLERALQ